MTGSPSPDPSTHQAALLDARRLLGDRTRAAAPPRAELSGVRRALTEFLWFGIRNARACLFAGAFFLAVFGVPRSGVLGVPRYDVLLFVALLIQAGMVWTGLETRDELKAITIFHLLGFGLEAFKTSSGIRSWSYPDFAWTKVAGVPLFSGFMYAAVGSYIIQAWRLFDLRIRHHPPWWMAGLVALAIYANFFTHHYIPDLRWYLAALALGLYARTTVVLRPLDRDRRMPLLASFLLIGFFIWLAENISTFFGIWRVSRSGRCMDGGARRQVELVVPSRRDDVHHRGEPQAHQGARARPGLTHRVAFFIATQTTRCSRHPALRRDDDAGATTCRRPAARPASRSAGRRSSGRRPGLPPAARRRAG